MRCDRDLRAERGSGAYDVLWLVRVAASRAGSRGHGGCRWADHDDAQRHWIGVACLYAEHDGRVEGTLCDRTHAVFNNGFIIFAECTTVYDRDDPRSVGIGA